MTQDSNKNNYKSNCNPVKFVNCSIGSNSTNEKGSTSIVNDKTKMSVRKSINIGNVSKTVKEKIKEATKLNKINSPKRNNNGKVWINKENNYKHVPDAFQKTFFNCGNSNHLAIDCRKNRLTKNETSKSDSINPLRYRP